MKTRILASLALAPLALLSLTTVARADAPTLSMGNGSYPADTGQCFESADREITQGTPRSKVFHVEFYVEQVMKAGDHTLGEIWDACAKPAGASIVEYLPARIDRIFAEIDAMPEARDTYSIDQAMGECKENIGRALRAGVDPATPIKSKRYEGTVGAVPKDVCDKGAAAVADFYAAHLSEHKKLLKSDKWTLLLKMYPDGYLVQGGNGERTSDAKALAKAKVWFDVSSQETSSCPTKVFSYRRYQFDKAGKLVKTTDKDYCGDPGLKALR
jgi:hypothetical protein